MYRTPCTHPEPPPSTNQVHLSHKKSLLKNKVLPSFLYNSGKQSSALYAGTVHVTATPRWQNLARLNPGGQEKTAVPGAG